MQAKYIALPASLPSGLKNWRFSRTNLHYRATVLKRITPMGSLEAH